MRSSRARPAARGRSLSDRSCPECGGRTPDGSRFCPHCGSRLDADAGSTAVIQPPPDETGPVPIRRAEVEPHLFGVTPPMALFALAVAALAVGLLLLVVGARLAGAVVLLTGVALLAAFVAVARRKPDSRLARASATAVDRARERATVGLDAFAARSRARRRLAGLRAELLQLDERRRAVLLELGRAVYGRDDAATEALRSELAELDRVASEKEAEMAAVVEGTREELEQARLEVQSTEMVEIPSSPGIADPVPGEATPPQPAPVPEPYPPPNEGDPPQPARVPEPYPPDEGTPPEPARIPEPGGERG